MDDFAKALLLALLPLSGNVAGAIVGEFVDVSRRTLSLALHAAAGIVLAVVAVELLPQALQVEPAWATIVAFGAGGLFFVITDRAVDLVAERRDGESTRAPWMILFAISVDLLGDGIMIGTGSTINLSLGLLLGLAQIPANAPEGFAATAAMKRRGLPRSKRLILITAITLPVLLGATAGYWLLRDQSLVLKMATLAFTAGILTTAVVEEIVPESHEGGEARLATLFFVGGFLLFMTLASYLD